MIDVITVVHRIMKVKPKNRTESKVRIERELLELVPRDALSDTVNLAVAKYLKEKGKIS